MVEKLVKVFTRDVSLFAAESWRDELIEKFQSAVGVTYKDAPITSNGKAVTAYYLENDVEAVKKASIAKLKNEASWYYDNREQFLQNMDNSRKKIKDLADADFTIGTVASLTGIFKTIFPMTRFCNFIPHFWLEDIKRELGSEADKLIAIALADRLKTEGVFELADTLLRKIIGKKLKQMKKPEIFAKFLTREELAALVEGKQIDWTEIAGRTAGYVYCKGKVHATPAYQHVFKQNGYVYVEDKVEGNSLKGVVAFSKGIVKAKVQVLFAVEDVSKFQEGRVMVTPMTMPDFIPAMKKASAIVTDEGGVTCHAAIVSRELGIPCVIGTKVATKLFKDGDEVEVDTVNGVVRKL